LKLENMTRGFAGTPLRRWLASFGDSYLKVFDHVFRARGEVLDRILWFLLASYLVTGFLLTFSSVALTFVHMSSKLDSGPKTLVILGTSVGVALLEASRLLGARLRSIIPREQAFLRFAVSATSFVLGLAAGSAATSVVHIHLVGGSLVGMALFVVVPVLVVYLLTAVALRMSAGLTTRISPGIALLSSAIAIMGTAALVYGPRAFSHIGLADLVFFWPNAVAGALCLAKTRAVIGLARRGSVLVYPGLAALDLAMSSCIWLGVVAFSTPTPLVWLRIKMASVLTPAVLFFASYHPTALLLLFLISALLLATGWVVVCGFRRLAPTIIVDRRPFRSVGLVAAVLLFLLFLLVWIL
jgi:hypothetical protein